MQEILEHDRLATTEISLNLSPEEVIREFHKKRQVASGTSSVVIAPNEACLFVEPSALAL